MPLSEKTQAGTESAMSLKIQKILPELTKSEAKIARYLLLNEAQLGLETGASVAAKAGVSEITVSRFLKRLGYKGISGLKEALRTEMTSALLEPSLRSERLKEGSLSGFLTSEAESLLALAQQMETENWTRMTATLDQARRVYVTGFQTVSGVAEDFAKRLNIVRSSVHFVSANSGGLVEWVDAGCDDYSQDVLIVVDIVPFAREAIQISRLAQKTGMTVVVITDEFNNWAYDYTDYVFHGRTKTGLFLETTAPLVTLQNFIVHAVAQKDPERTQHRRAEWQSYLSELKLYFS
ncbi:MurR/RpiR family transcriptional regulator [Tritonibacter mobilis]|uniref:Transcriptional regulator RpiR family protein n=1 Tax=Tritonibacter mobilis F1926 TaxID=1265309 RepID=A0A1B1A543_9RHOB|nr:transcriptional regulator RpiR family protein [Tritonibacter mobilis F1926]KJZ22070.1 transcriptional regulator RpiR family protein [Tritonibacter mobilis]